MGGGIGDALRRVTAALAAGESRPGQVAMAEAVGRAVDSGRHLVVQAGTGTGKSLAYLVPAILSGRTAVVSTATKALQDQLVGRDLPFLARALGRPFSFVVLKGRSNYVCRQRVWEIANGRDDQLTLDDDTLHVTDTGREVRRLVEWAATTETGDRAALPFEPRPRAWSAVSVSAMECPGVSKCPAGDECFAEAARARAADADVVVVNHHLYGAHLATGGYVVPEHDLVIFDEAHELEDVMAASLGIELSPGRLRALARTARPVDVDKCAELDRAADVLEAALRPHEGQRVSRPLPDTVADALTLASQRVAAVVSAAQKEAKDNPRLERALQSGGHLAGDIGRIVDPGPGEVTWVEDRGSGPALEQAPVDVATLLADRLWSEVTGVFTSATIPPRLAERLGLPADGVDALDAGSPFDFGEQALLYCAAHLPDPRRPEHADAAIEELERLIRAAGGRTLALFTSWKAMHAAADRLRDRLPWRVLTQSDLPKPALVEAFASDETSCLFATMGFWQGVDVPGAALSLVVIDKLPFSRPDEPLLQARRELAGPAAFRLIDLPRAATLLAQGCGRLVRTATDRGVVAVLDPRLASANYRWDLVRALPPMRRTRHLHDVEAFLAPLRERTPAPS